MAELNHRIAKFIENTVPGAREKKYLLAASGGVDSLVMVHILHREGFSIQLAHCNFNLRGEESDSDQEFIESFASELKIKSHTKSFDTKTYAKEKGLSTQMAARELRYQWFGQLIRSARMDYICTAHHVDDSLETLLFNLAKGTGLAGLTGISAMREFLLRPLVDITKEEIIQYAKDNSLEWREDSSNESLQYKRNYLRNIVIPGLKEINPSFTETGKNTLERLSASHKLLSRYIHRYIESRASLEGKDILLDTSGMEGLDHEERSLILSHWLNPFGYNYIQAKEVSASLSRTGKLFLTEKYQLCVDRDRLILSPKNLPTLEVIQITEEPVEFRTEKSVYKTSVRDIDKWELSLDSAFLQLDMDKLSFPLRLRKWQKGDWFIPLGMKGKKKISDFMIDRKIPVNFKHELLLLESNDEIVGIPGWQVDDRYKITEETIRVFTIEKRNA